MSGFSVRGDVRVEVLEGALVVLDPGSLMVYELSGAEAEAFRLVEAGAVEVPAELEPAIAALVHLRLVEATGWDRRRVLLAGGVVAAACIVSLALPNVAAAASGNGGGGGGGGTLPIQRLLAVTDNYTTYQIDVYASGANNGRAGIRNNQPARSQVAEVPGIAQQSDFLGSENVNLANVNPVSFQKVDPSGNAVSPAEFLVPSGQNYVWATVPTDPTAASTFRKNATFKAVPPLKTGSGVRVSFESLLYPNWFIRHSGTLLRLNSYSSQDIFLKDATFERVLEP